VWLLAALGVAGAAPLMHAGRLDWVCSASGQAKLVQVGADADAQSDAALHATGTLQCPNCLLGGPLPTFAVPSQLSAPKTSRLPLPGSDASPPQLTSMPPPARGPPMSI